MRRLITLLLVLLTVDLVAARSNPSGSSASTPDLSTPAVTGKRVVGVNRRAGDIVFEPDGGCCNVSGVFDVTFDAIDGGSHNGSTVMDITVFRDGLLLAQAQVPIWDITAESVVRCLSAGDPCGTGIVDGETRVFNCDESGVLCLSGPIIRPLSVPISGAGLEAGDVVTLTVSPAGPQAAPDSDPSDDVVTKVFYPAVTTEASSWGRVKSNYQHR